jgi:hypothetical protein
MKIKLIVVQLLRSISYARFEIETPVVRKIIKWLIMDGVTIGLYFLIASTLLISCRSVNMANYQGKKSPIPTKLLTLERQFGDVVGPTYNYGYHYGNTNGHNYGYPNGYSNFMPLSGDELKVINNEVDENLTDPFGDKYGYIEFNRRIVNAKYGIGWAFLSTITFFVPNLLGMPFMNLKLDTEMEVKIYDINRKLVAKYTGMGHSQKIIAMYYGYGLMASRWAYPQAMMDALDQIRPQIEADVDRVNKLLKEAKK